MLDPPAINLANLQVRTISQCFSCLQLSLAKASAKIRRIIKLAKKICQFYKKLYFCNPIEYF